MITFRDHISDVLSKKRIVLLEDFKIVSKILTTEISPKSSSRIQDEYSRYIHPVFDAYLYDLLNKIDIDIDRPFVSRKQLVELLSADIRDQVSIELTNKYSDEINSLNQTIDSQKILIKDLTDKIEFLEENYQLLEDKHNSTYTTAFNVVNSTYKNLLVICIIVIYFIVIWALTH